VAGSVWRRGVVWSDSSVDDKRLLLVPDPAGLQGLPVVIRGVYDRRSAVARVERSDKGNQARVHPALARQLGVESGRFEAEWRHARWHHLVFRYRKVVLATGLTPLAGTIAAAVGLSDATEKVGWGLAGLVFVVSVIALLVKAHNDLQSLTP
jgi:hypothetical protein